MIYLYEHGGSENHGCEAIVRSTCGIIGKDVTLFSNDITQDKKYHVDKICRIRSDEKKEIRRGNFEWFISSVDTKLTKGYYYLKKFQHKELLKDVKHGDIFLSIGGDNYCYPGTELIAAKNKCLRAKGAKTVLWGCSVEPSILADKKVAEDIAHFDLITTRETISYEALKKVNSNVVLASDPAFTLQKEELPLPELWKEGNTIGINASPLILNSSKNPELVLDAYKRLIEHILQNTDSAVALIPHVVWSNNDDRTVLSTLYEQYKHTNRVLLIMDATCEQLKGYIARCRFFIGARTHATIAAYSSCVPTLVLGYSVKSRGIAKDLFGTEKNYVVSVKQMKSDEELVDAFKWIFDNEKSIRDHLKNTIEEYIEKAYLAKKGLEELF